MVYEMVSTSVVPVGDTFVQPIGRTAANHSLDLQEVVITMFTLQFSLILSNSFLAIILLLTFRIALLV